MVLTKDKFPMPGPEQCHPSIGNERPAIGCLPLTVLQNAAKTLGIQTTDETIRADLEKKLRVSPKQEYSFLKKLPISKAEKDTLLKKFLRPPAPIAWKKDPDMWLDSLNIADVMNQYETAFPNFDFKLFHLTSLFFFKLTLNFFICITFLKVLFVSNLT